MTAFVILAAGGGKRMGETGKHLHKALLPLDGRAIISRQIALAPDDARIIVVTGSRAQQIRDYLHLAHPDLTVTWVHVPGWDHPGAGPGDSLLAAREAIGDDDLIFTACDTLWELAHFWAKGTWIAAAEMPEGSSPERWCRIAEDGKFYDKTPGPEGAVYTGLGSVLKHDLPVFWKGIEDAELTDGERQVTGGLRALMEADRLALRWAIGWTDLGDEESYKRAVKHWSGYDWSKPDEATWVLPETHRVVKFRRSGVTPMIYRQYSLHPLVPVHVGARKHMFAYEYVQGRTAYDAAENDPDLVLRLLHWAQHTLWEPVSVTPMRASEACAKFYWNKTIDRIKMLRPELQEDAFKVFFSQEDAWAKLLLECEPVRFHGDFNLGNIIVTANSQGAFDGFRLIDWRADFADQLDWGDKRYDLGKLLAGLVINWDRARRGNFQPWIESPHYIDKMAAWFGGEIPDVIWFIAALSLLNCAPLHSGPLDEILVYLATRITEEPALGTR